MRSPSLFETEFDASIGRRFLDDGFVVVAAEDMAALTRIQALAAGVVAKRLDRPVSDPKELLDNVHRHIAVSALNDLRLEVIEALRNAPWFRPALYALARRSLAAIVGNELAMQRGIGLSVQYPSDKGSLLPIHADVWDGDSPFEVVLWTPLVDCAGTKSMYLVPPSKDRAVQARLGEFGSGSAEDIFRSVRDDAAFLTVPFGSVLIFSQTLMHGNRVNDADETRWSLNCRFKSVLSPYADKKLGEFFEVITLRPATKLGLSYRTPEGFDE